MRIGILGSGLMGAKLGTIFARAGHDVVFSYSHSERKLKRLARDAQGNARAGTPREAALHADALLLAVHWSRVDAVLKQAGDLSDKVIVTCSLPMNANDKLRGTDVRLSKRGPSRRRYWPGSVWAARHLSSSLVLGEEKARTGFGAHVGWLSNVAFDVSVLIDPHSRPKGVSLQRGRDCDVTVTRPDRSGEFYGGLP
jgi:NADP oxidoreductase coenzyme F420-dependent